MESIDFSEAVVTHCEWVVRLHDVIYGSGEEIDILALERDDCCPLGAWINGEGTRYMRLATFKIMRNDHTAFHLSAGHVARLIHKGRLDEAEAQFEDRSTFAAHTDALIRSLEALEKVIP